MKRYLMILLVLAFALNAIAQTSIAGVSFGSTYSEASKILQEKFGKPDTEEKDQLIFVGKGYGGFYFDLLIFGFQYGDGRSYLNKCIFLKAFKTSSEAKEFREIFAQKLGKDYTLNEYVGNNKFKGYKGGSDPTDDESFGFFLDVLPPEGPIKEYGVRLYYGPYNYVTENF